MYKTQTGPGCGRTFALLLAFAGPASADPAWWNDPSTKIWTNSPQNIENWAPVNLGQLKHVANQARIYLESRLGQADGAGAAVNAICQFDQTDNYAPATVGQLKNVAKVFYDRLGQIGYNWQTGTFGLPSTPYPWTGTVNPENQAPCNIGQLKNLFTFEISPAFLAIDGDGDGLPSWWEKVYGLGPAVWNDPDFDSDGDGLSNSYEHAWATNPNLVDTDGDEASDLEEAQKGTDPKLPTSTPLALCYIVHSEYWGVNYLPPVPPNGVEPIYPEWFDGFPAGYYPRQGDHQITEFSPSSYQGRDHLGTFHRDGGAGDPNYSPLNPFASQTPDIPAKDPTSAIIHDYGDPVTFDSFAGFGTDGAGIVSTEATAVWIRGPKSAVAKTYLIRVTKTHQGDALPVPTVEVTYQSIVLPPNANSSTERPFIAHLSGASAQRNYSESTHLRLDLVPIDIATETIATQPAKRDRRKIGIGEEVKLTFSSPENATVTWSMKSGEGTLTTPVNYGPKEIQFNAGGEEETAEIEAILTNYQNAKVTVSFNVVTPKSVFFEKVATPPGYSEGNGISIGNNPIGIKMLFYADYYYGPDDVCFYNLVAGETGVPAIRTGSFLDDPSTNQAHLAWIGNAANPLTNTVIAGKGTKGPTPDAIGIGRYQPPIIDKVGRFEWNLEWKYRLKSGVGNGTPFAPVTQWMEIIPGQGINGFTGRGGKGNVTVQ